MPSIGSINQKELPFLLLFKSTVSSETIGISGVNFKILLVIILFTSKSPLLTGVPSDLICFLIGERLQATAVLHTTTPSDG